MKYPRLCLKIIVAAMIVNLCPVLPAMAQTSEVSDTSPREFLLIEQAIAAAHEMRFKPANRHGLAVPYWVPILVEFNLR
jgi:hypothetical protein